MLECQTLLKPSLVDEEATDGLGPVISLDVGPEGGTCVGRVWDMCRSSFFLLLGLAGQFAGKPIMKDISNALADWTMK